MDHSLFVSPLSTTTVFLAALFGIVVASMFLISRFLPAMSEDAHASSRWLDGLRGLAATLVALNHAPFALIDQGLTPKVFYFPLWQHDLFRTLGAIGVQLFFCITGALFTRKLLDAESVDWTSFFAKRLRRIAPAYFVAATLAIFVAIWAVWPNPVDPAWLIRFLPAIYSMGMMQLPKIAWMNMEQLIGVNWTLGIEWMFYLMLPVVFVLTRRARSLTMGLIGAFALGDAYLTGSSTWAFFVIGAAIAPLIDKPMPTAVRLAGYLGAAAAVVWIVVEWVGTPNYGLERFAQIAMLVTSLALAKPWVLRTRTMVSLGTVSYSFYLLHLMSIYVTARLFQQHVGDIAAMSVRPYALLVGGSLVIAVVASTASYLLVERPFMRGKKRGGVVPGAVTSTSAVSRV